MFDGSIVDAVQFFRPHRTGNGRSCATCHRPEDGFGLTPATVEARYQQWQARRRHDPSADDPLFRPIDMAGRRRPGARRSGPALIDQTGEPASPGVRGRHDTDYGTTLQVPSASMRVLCGRRYSSTSMLISRNDARVPPDIRPPPAT